MINRKSLIKTIFTVMFIGIQLIIAKYIPVVIIYEIAAIFIAATIVNIYILFSPEENNFIDLG